MRLSLLLSGMIAGLPVIHIIGQQQLPPPGSPIGGAQPSRYNLQRTATAELTSFDLDFPGGTPKQLVAAIQKAMGRPLNVIVPDEYNDVQVPALKMSHVNVQQLFQALEQASTKTELVPLGPHAPNSYSTVNSGYGFQAGPGPLSDDTIWYFHADRLPQKRPEAPETTCRFYSLAPFLDRELFTIDDITTAIETGWKMLGETSPPKISFHKETKLLIAVGEPSKLEIVDSALKALTMRQPAFGDRLRTAIPRSTNATPRNPTGPTGSTEPPKGSSGE